MPKKSSFKSSKDSLNLPEKRIFVGPASIWKRIAAFILDILLLDFLILGFFDKTLRKLLKADTTSGIFKMLQSDTSIATTLVMIFFILTMIIMAYFVLQEYLIGQTLGKMLLGLRVISTIDPDQLQQISFLQALLRSMFLIPTIPFIFLWAIDPIYLLFKRDGQRLSEWLCKTRVIEVYQF